MWRQATCVNQTTLKLTSYKKIMPERSFFDVAPDNFYVNQSTLKVTRYNKKKYARKIII